MKLFRTTKRLRSLLPLARRRATFGLGGALTATPSRPPRSALASPANVWDYYRMTETR
ncbi:hypothetical protein KCP77_09200 [Salmonella enterica subsp. enterica]|nr:hypothetical protein KCP77_09200 [Salmonella enterica subsp. enterica]